MNGFWRSPRTWGWTATRTTTKASTTALPTHVGMDRAVDLGSRPEKRAPHARGDGPAARLTWPVGVVRSPRTWGWTGATQDRAAAPEALPTHVGMDRAAG